MKVKDYQKLKKKLAEDAPKYEAGAKLVAPAKQSGDKLKTLVKSTQADLKDAPE